MTTSAIDQGPTSSPDAKSRRRSWVWSSAGDERARSEASDEPEPDGEDLAMLAPGALPVLGHHRKGVDGVAANHEGERPRASPERDELEPDDGAKADDGRPSSEARRVGSRGHGWHADRPEHSCPECVEGREGVEPCPDREDECRDQGDPDPPVDPGEEPRDLGIGLATEDGLDHDPGPADDADRTQEAADGAGTGRPGVSVGGGAARRSRSSTKANERPTAPAAPIT